ncbi:MAG: acyl-[acyl-carrier-protein]--UDP-N-acetylglucosamine O-acyltransferase [Caedibacter sp. 38-128]|nr:acyl-ACP--UDP-N-acetylglucosamine O-acyltransferase [Holosporales bacterium]OJX05755.1 MAG: acyl-[acyl-carrier-protein]--UDP-N-acetylglucosamine O-acyltransferase [Caedibacter sp. 38-128]
MVETLNVKFSETQIHPTAVVEPTVKLGKGVKIGPYCVLSGDVILEDEVHLISHVVIAGHTTIGAKTTIYPFASIGHLPQDLKHKGEPSLLKIGKHNVIREYVTMQGGTEGGGLVTTIGNHCFFMASSHVAHDCTLGNHIIMANCATLAGHVQVADYAIIGGLSAIHQFVRIGQHAIIGGMSAVENDVIPYGSVKGDRANLYGINMVGLKRRNFTRETVECLRIAYKDIFEGSLPLKDRAENAAQKYKDEKTVQEIIEFILSSEAKRPLCVPKANVTN